MAGISEKELRALLDAGHDSEMIRLRLAYSEVDSTLRYLRPLVGKNRVHPRYLPTQKSGRWSITGPPLANFSARCIAPECTKEGEHRVVTEACWSLRELIVPEPGHWFLKWDWSAIEAKLAAAYSGDDEDLDLFARDADIHTVTLCKMYGMPIPEDVVNPYKAGNCEEWRRVTGLYNKDCWQRTGAKTSRFSLAYGVDERAIHEAKDVDLLAKEAGLDRAGIEAMAKAYLDSKPKLKAWKRQVWGEIIKTSEVRTPLGRRKRLFISAQERERWMKWGRPGDACKEGLNHLAQGQVADMMNLTIIAIKRRWPQSRFGFQAHDGHLSVWPNEINPWPEIREIVERVWDVGNGRSIKSTAEWAYVRDDGSHGELK